MTVGLQIEAEDVGDIKKVVIRHDDSGLGSGWFLQHVSIFSM